MRGVLLRSTTIILAVVLSLPVLGQDAQKLRDRDPDLEGAKKVAGDLQQANFHWGNFYLLSRFRISDAGYSENAYLPASSGGALSLAVEAPHRLYYVPHRKVVFTAEVVPGYHVLADENLDDSRDRLHYLTRGDAHFLFNRLYLDIYTSRADQLRAHVADVNQLARTREGESGIAGEAKYSSRTSATFALRYRDTEYPDDRFEPGDTPLALLDRSERNGRVSLNHKTFPLTSLFVSAEASNYGFRNATFMDSSRRWYGAGAAFDNGRTQVRLEAGPAKLEFEDPLQNDFSGVIGSLRASRGFARWTFHGQLARDVGFSIYQNNLYFVADTARAGVDYTATRRLTLRGGSAYEIDRYDTPLNGRDRQDTISFTSVGFNYGIRRVRAGVDVGWYERDSTYNGDVDSGIRYILHLSFTP